jgi:hypothetical protein
MKPTIKAYVNYSEYSNTHYYRQFQIVEYLPAVGDEIDGWTVESIDPVTLDCEQGSDQVYDFDYYTINVVDTVGLERVPKGNPSQYHDTLYYAVLKNDE